MRVAAVARVVAGLVIVLLALPGPGRAAHREAASAAVLAPGAPVAPRRPVKDTVQGVEIVDGYRWLEDANAPETQAWTAAQSQATRRWVAGLPGFPVLKERIAGILAKRSVVYTPIELAGGRLFAVRSDPAKQQASIVTLPSADELGGEQVVVDPNVLDASGKTTVDWFVPSPDGTRVAVSLSRGGTERGDLHVFAVATGREIERPLAHVQGGTAGGSLAWARDGSAFWYTRYPQPGERPPADAEFWQQVWFHTVGRPESEDRPQLTDLPRIAEIALSGDPTSQAVLADVRNGDSEQHALFVSRGPGQPFVKLAGFEDKAVNSSLSGGALWVVSRKASPRGEVLRVPLDGGVGRGVRVVAAAAGAIESVSLSAERVYVREIDGGPERLRVFDVAGKELAPVAAPPVASVSDVVRLQPGAVLFHAATYLQPGAWYRYDERTGQVAQTALRTRAAVDFSPYEVAREECRSRDGTRVPLTVLRKKGRALDGKIPTLLTGYGGFNISLSPSYSATNIVWLEQGGVVAIANLRGGGEYGEEWHDQGRLTRKQNVFDDFLSCAEHLIEAGYTTPQKLAILGGSNGGLLMGAALTQKPHLFRAVVAAVGIYDMLRVELSPNGAFTTTEFGSVRDPKQFEALRAYSPYHHVLDGVAYPSVLITAGSGDPRVDAMQSRKFAARLQAASSSGNPVLLQQDEGGHGIGASRDERVEKAALIDAFLLHELGVEVKRVAHGAAQR